MKQIANKDDICQQFNVDKATGLVLSNTVTVLVSVVNIIIRTINIKLVDYISYHTHSQATGAIMMSIFVASFINTGIILLFTNAYLEHSILSFVPKPTGQYADIDKNWYLDISSALVKTMLIMACFPWIEFFLFGGIRILKKLLDGGWYFGRT